MAKEILKDEILNEEELEQVAGGDGEYNIEYDYMSYDDLEKLARKEIGFDDHLERHCFNLGIPGRYGYRYFFDDMLVVSKKYRELYPDQK